MIALGLLLAALMGVLGMWQASRATQVGEAGIAARASAAPVPLLQFVNDDGTVGDVYGRPVTASGTYLANQQLLVPTDQTHARVLTALKLDDGRVVPVVRGVAPLNAIPNAPAGIQQVTGIFLPGEAEAASPGGSSMIGSIRTPLIAQYWPQRVTPGFITVDAAASAAQGLAPAQVTLPSGDKSLQNGSYAIQWWVFAGFALVMAGVFARQIGVRERERREAALMGLRPGAEDDVAPTDGAGTVDATPEQASVTREDG